MNWWPLPLAVSIMSFPLDSLNFDINPLVSITGQVVNQADEGIDSVEMVLSGDVSMMVQTDVTGEFSLNSLSPGGTCTLTPEKDINIRNGLSTLDILRIQQHILFIDPFASPYDMIAADINNSGGISQFDIISMRRVLLFDIDTFPDNQSWRFVDAAYVFSSAETALQDDFPESVDCSPLSNLSIDFVGIKIGDVTGNADPGMIVGEEDTRTEQELILQLPDLALDAGESYQIPVTVSEDIALLGGQLEWRFDPNELQLETISAGILSLGEDEIGRRFISEGILLSSWSKGQAYSIANKEKLFYLNITAQRSGQLRDMLTLGNQRLNAEFYTADLTIRPITLQFSTTNTSLTHSIQPNPFTDQFQIQFATQRAGKGLLQLYDARGQLVYQASQNVIEGSQSWQIFTDRLLSNGMYFYELNTPDQRFTGRLVKR